MPKSIGRSEGIAFLLGLVAIVLAVAFFTRTRDDTSVMSPVDVEGASRVGGETRDVSQGGTIGEVDAGQRSAGGSGPVADTSLGADDIDRDFDIALRWSRVDLDAMRESMPDNLYWKLSAPTTEPEVERERAEERARWNEEYGKVLSGTASDAEIEAYYAQRYRLSTDYIEFANQLLANYGDVLPARDVGLLELSVKMHHARLQEMPRRLAEAHERKARQDRLREAWLADEAAFEQAQAEEIERARR